MTLERVFNLYPPLTSASASFVSKVLSKLTPLVGNHIELRMAEVLNASGAFRHLGEWIRQDPGHPDVVLAAGTKNLLGIEVKAWFPFATEITGRFKLSQSLCRDSDSLVCIVAWMPSRIVCGEPKILDMVTVSARSVAEARDRHYFDPPKYLVSEPVDTTDRSSNLQQLNTEGFLWQKSPDAPDEFRDAEALVESWGTRFRHYSTDPDFQNRIRDLRGRFRYRTDTNFAKIDRIDHEEIESFKRRVLSRVEFGLTVEDWSKVLAQKGSKDASRLTRELVNRLELDVQAVDDSMFDEAD